MCLQLTVKLHLCSHTPGRGDLEPPDLGGGGRGAVMPCALSQMVLAQRNANRRRRQRDASPRNSACIICFYFFCFNICLSCWDSQEQGSHLLFLPLGAQQDLVHSR